jgi:cyclase
MKLTRKEFLRTSIILGSGMFLPGENLLAHFQYLSKGFRSIGNNTGVYIEKGGTIGCYISDDAVVVIDSQYPDSAKNFMNGLQQKTSRKIDILFNTHHHGDHTSGNIYLKDFASKIVAHENCRLLQEKNDKKEPAKPQAYADTTFKETWSQDLGKDKVTATHFGPGHTGGDSVIHFEKENIAHVGDLVFNKTFPFIDLDGGGLIKNWAIVLEKVASHYPKDTKYFFGHAINDDLIVGSATDLGNMANYLVALIEFVEAEVKEGKTKEEISLETEIPGFADLKERWPGARKMNLERAYDQLTR